MASTTGDMGAFVRKTSRKIVKETFKLLFPSLCQRHIDKQTYLAEVSAEMEYSAHEIITLRKYVENKSFIDVGANVGAFSRYLKPYAKKVIAFEPIPQTADRLRRFNRSICVHAVALSNRPGEMNIYIPHIEGRPILTRCSLNADANVGFDTQIISVPVNCLDHYNFTDVGAIKIDVEGHEMNVILGARSTILKYQPVLLIEIEERNHPGRSDEIVEFIRSLGYVCMYINTVGELRNFQEFDFTILQNPSNLPKPFQGSAGVYINNFVFLPTRKISSAP